MNKLEILLIAMRIGLVHNETLARLIAMHCTAVTGAQCNEGVDRPELCAQKCAVNCAHKNVLPK
jgi:hypothetical protein